MTYPDRMQNGPYQLDNDALRLALLDKLPALYAAEPERHRYAQANAQALAPHVRTIFPEIEEGAPEDQLLHAALTKIFFSFSNPNDIHDTPTVEQMAGLCAAVANSMPSTINFPEGLDTIATYLYCYSGESFIGPWFPETSSAERFTAAVNRLFLGIQDNPAQSADHSNLWWRVIP